MAALLDQTQQSLVDWLKGSALPEYRAKQIYRWILDLTPPSGMSDIPHELRTKIESDFVSGYPSLISHAIQEGEGADRFLLKLGDGEAVESVRIGEADNYTACISTQVGCGLRCSFCASGKYGLTRNLTAGEIVGQVLALRKETHRESGLDGWPRHIVYMGMGEPFNNYGATIESVKRLIDPEGINFGTRRITISTAGLVPEIYRFAEDNLQVGLAVSLHAPNSELRRSLMPIEEVYPLASLLRACRHYIAKTGRRLTFEYVLLAGVNDHASDARKLVELFKDWKLVHFNLIRYNPIGMTRLQSPSVAQATTFLRKMQDGGLQVTLRKSPGRSIQAACGQLRGLEFEKAKRSRQEPDQPSLNR